MVLPNALDDDPFAPPSDPSDPASDSTGPALYPPLPRFSLLTRILDVPPAGSFNPEAGRHEGIITFLNAHTAMTGRLLTPDQQAAMSYLYGKHYTEVKNYSSIGIAAGCAAGLYYSGRPVSPKRRFPLVIRSGRLVAMYYLGTLAGSVGGAFMMSSTVRNDYENDRIVRRVFDEKERLLNTRGTDWMVNLIAKQNATHEVKSWGVDRYLGLEAARRIRDARRRPIYASGQLWVDNRQRQGQRPVTRRHVGKSLDGDEEEDGNTAQAGGEESSMFPNLEHSGHNPALEQYRRQVQEREQAAQRGREQGGRNPALEQYRRGVQEIEQAAQREREQQQNTGYDQQSFYGNDQRSASKPEPDPYATPQQQQPSSDRDPFDFDNSSPASTTQGTSSPNSTGSSWERLRTEKNSDGKQSWERLRNSENQKKKASGGEDSYVYDEAEEERQLAKEEAKKEFERMMERERQGKGVDRFSGERRD